MRAKKSLGQNFLVDESAAARIVAALAPRADETIIEIGAGRGALTRRLVELAGRLIAIELDRDLAPALRARFGARANFTLVEADALTVDFCALVRNKIERGQASANLKEANADAAKANDTSLQTPAVARLVANLPYNISTAILQKLIARRECISEMILMLQREVVERIAAPPGSSERGYISVLVEAYCETETLFDVAPQAFRPVPKVWSSVVRLRARDGTLNAPDEKLFRRIVSAGFAQKRKTILNNLRHAPDDLRERIEACGGAQSVLERAHIEPSRRAETLALKEWLALRKAVDSGEWIMDSERTDWC